VWERRDSTNPRAWEAVQAGVAPGWVVLAEEQEAGRGRQGRRWCCPPHAGLLFSLVAPAVVPKSARPQLLPLALALGVCEALRQITASDIRTKWPNDLVLQDAKLAGLLVEARPSVPQCVVVGCGINVRVPAAYLADQVGFPAASLHDDGRPLRRREEILARVLASMETWLEAWSACGYDCIRERWLELDVVPGREVEAHLAGGVERGTALGITEAGLLRLQLASGTVRELAAGEVHLR
jgi:BirA family biotin operon repressor/biotin-[acetyl-CoA-carboxylase] ligase